MTTNSTSTKPISDLLRIHPRFLRSVNLERDYADPNSSMGFIPTPVSIQAIQRVLASFRQDSTQRAWRIAGDYGSGKTAWALALSRIAAGAKNELPNTISGMAKLQRVLPAIATGAAEPLGLTVFRALGEKNYDQQIPPTDEVLKAVRRAKQRAHKQGYTGILLVLDELGKNLEYASRNPDTDDVFLLQQIAEEASKVGEASLTVVVMLHQGVASYAAGLDSTSRREWNKVAGRFEEIVYAHPLQQVATLIAATLNPRVKQLPRTVEAELRNAMEQAIQLNLYGASASNSMADLAVQMFPLHPTVLPVIARTMKRFGQNERSLFSFLSSAEPLGLQQHASLPLKTAGLFRIHHFFDYVSANFTVAILGSPSHTAWTMVESIVAASSCTSTQELQILKTVAMLNLLDAPDLAATIEFVSIAVPEEEAIVAQSLTSLQERGILYQRGTIKGYCLWPHTSLSLQDCFEKARAAVHAPLNDSRVLCEHTRSEDLVPREYYVKTGTLRYADVKLIPVSKLRDTVALAKTPDGSGADISVYLVVPSDQSEKKFACKQLSEMQAETPPWIVFGLTEPISGALAALNDVMCWRWVKENIPQLSGDRFAREEVSRQINHAERVLNSRLIGLTNLAIPSRLELTWFDCNGEQKLAPGRTLLKFLGEKCEALYPRTPRVLNELINRRFPSSAAVAARTKLVDAMASSPHLPNLGLDDTKRPPEMALYLSVLKAGNLHRQFNEEYEFRLPSSPEDHCLLLPAINAITSLLKQNGMDTLVAIPEVFRMLSAPPFGIRQGLLPFIIAIYIVTHDRRIAVYEDRTYLPAVNGEAFMRLMKEPRVFTLQYCAVDGVREEAFRKILEVLKYSSHPSAQKHDLMDVVRPLMMFISREVPDFSRQTKNLSTSALSVRKALLEAREPSNLIFRTLPQSCGFLPIETGKCYYAEDFAHVLSTSLHEIRESYPALLQRLATSVCNALREAGDVSSARKLITCRARTLADRVTETSLKSFALRLADASLEEQSWIESVANLLARKSPERWNDLDEAEFYNRLEVLSARFRRTELSLVGTNQNLNGNACGIFLTKSDGSEVGELINWTGLEHNRLQRLESQINQIMIENGEYAVAATLRALWTQLQPLEEEPTS